MRDWSIAAITIIIIGLFAGFAFGQWWTIYENFMATGIFAIFLKLKD